MFSRCAGCALVGESPCRRCLARLDPAEPPCPQGLDSCRAVCLFSGVGRSLIVALKYRNQRQSLGWMAGALAQVSPKQVDVVTWVPTSSQRRRRRGFDQAELLARRTGRRLGVPTQRLLRPPQPRDASEQTGRNAAQRHDRGAFRSLRPVVGLSVLVIDDVLTTGASMQAAAATLRTAGAIEVHGAVVAFTPAPEDRGVRS